MPDTASLRRAQICSAFANEVLAARKRLDLSMSEVAQRAGLSQQMVSYVERQLRNPTLDTMLRLADALEIDATDMLRAAHQNAPAPASSIGKKTSPKKTTL